MGLNPLDPGKLLALMVFGGLSALAGLWLILRPHPEGSPSKIEVFGLKFESSSAGVLVFLIGAAFLAIPLFVEERPDIATARETQDDLRTSSEDQGSGDDPGSTKSTNGETVTGAPSPLIRVSGEEQEPNNDSGTPNLIPAGAAVRGKVPPGDVDSYRIEHPKADDEVIFITLRRGGRLSVIDEVGREVAEGPATFTFSGPASGGPYTAQVTHYLSSKQNYELTTAVRPAE